MEKLQVWPILRDQIYNLLQISGLTNCELFWSLFKGEKFNFEQFWETKISILVKIRPSELFNFMKKLLRFGVLYVPLHTPKIEIFF